MTKWQLDETARRGISFGDMAIFMDAQKYTLRPSIGALYRIEQQCLLPITGLIKRLGSGNPPLAMLRIVFRECMKAAGCALDDSNITEEQLKNALPYFFAFLLRGIGQVQTESLASLQQPNWRDMFTSYTGVMQRSTHEFWQITLEEYALMLEGFCLTNKIDIPSAAAPATSQDLAEMLQRFPDRKLYDGRSND